MRLSVMKLPSTFALVALPLMALPLSACGGDEASRESAATPTTAAAVTQPAATADVVVTDPLPPPPPAAKPAVTLPSESRDPRLVLVAWAKAMSLKDWDSAYLYWGEHGAASGQTLEQFRAAWGTLKDPQFDIYPGQGEGAAGSSYYTAPLVLIDGGRRVKGRIVLRRVNDVPGATPEQLRWHIEKLTIRP